MILDNLLIIDMASHQDPDLIDYDLLSKNINGVILRCAYGVWKDAEFEKHYAEFTKRGVPIGTYLFLINYKPASEQVATMVNAVSGKIFKLGYWCDVELERGAENLTSTRVIEFMTLAEKKLGKLGIYTGNWCWLPIMGNYCDYYNDRKHWISAYTSYDWFIDNLPDGWDNWTMWQYSDRGKVSGYTSSLDMNKFNGSASDWKLWSGKDLVQEDNMLFQVRCLVANLYQRSTPEILSTNIVGKCVYNQVYSVYEEKNGFYRIGLGKWASSKPEFMQKVLPTTEPSDSEKLKRLWAAHPELY